jgi:hypothetical protein
LCYYTPVSLVSCSMSRTIFSFVILSHASGLTVVPTNFKRAAWFCAHLEVLYQEVNFFQFCF